MLEETRRLRERQRRGREGEEVCPLGIYSPETKRKRERKRNEEKRRKREERKNRDFIFAHTYQNERGRRRVASSSLSSLSSCNFDLYIYIYTHTNTQTHTHTHIHTKRYICIHKRLYVYCIILQVRNVSTRFQTIYRFLRLPTKKKKKISSLFFLPIPRILFPTSFELQLYLQPSSTYFVSL